MARSSGSGWEIHLSTSDVSIVAGDRHPTFDELCLDQVERILKSETFRTAATLQHIFHFLAERALQAGKEEIKEYTIGLELLGRKDDFDPKTDTIVRVQMHRLRQRLST